MVQILINLPGRRVGQSDRIARIGLALNGQIRLREIFGKVLDRVIDDYMQTKEFKNWGRGKI